MIWLAVMTRWRELDDWLYSSRFGYAYEWDQMEREVEHLKRHAFYEVLCGVLRGWGKDEPPWWDTGLGKYDGFRHSPLKSLFLGACSCSIPERIGSK